MKKIIIGISMICVLSFVSCDGDSSTSNSNSAKNYVANVNSGKLHSIYCDSLPYEKNRVYFSTIEEANAAGYTDNHKECMGN